MRTETSNPAGSSVLISPPLTASIGVQPIEQGANATASQGNRAVRSSVINIDGVAIGLRRVSAGKHNVVHVAVALVVGLRAKDPRIASQQALFRILKVEQCEAQPVQTAGRRVPYSVVKHEPSSGCFNGRRRQTNLVGIPPSAAPRFQYEPVPAPMAQGRRIGDPHVRAEW